LIEVYTKLSESTCISATSVIRTIIFL